VQKYFEEIKDTRQEWKIKHKLIEILVTGISAVISGCEYFEDIADYCRVKCEWFREKMGLELANGTASHDTYQRVLEIIEPKEFEKCFVKWVASIRKKTKDEIVSIDGKTVCGSGDEANPAIQMVSAWANANRLVLGQVKVNDKTNEIKAVPELLEILYLKGCIVTIDATGCQKEISEKITAKKADYVFSLKKNHPDLYNDVKFYFANEAIKKIKVTEDKKHGRIEKREYYLETNTDWLSGRNEWTNLNGIGMVKSTVSEKDKIREETRYFITSLMSVDLFAKSVRQHWGIENSLHWCLDMVFHEDDCQVRAGNAAENFAVIRHIALNILKNYPIKMSLARKRRKCLYDSDFMADVLLSAFS
jgi:predicted transposase YbfD/YdcC